MLFDHTITLDIETVPSQDPQVRRDIADSIQPPGNISKAETIAAWNMDKKPQAIEDALRKTSFDGARGHCAVVGLQFDDDEPFTIYSSNWLQDEAAVMAEAFARMDEFVASYCQGRAPLFIGHNILNFDFRFIFQRAVMLRTKPSAHIPFGARPWDERTFDTMARWTGGGSHDYVSQDIICKALGIAGKGSELGGIEIDGSMVWDFIKAGRIDEVATYCGGDISRAYGMYKRMTFQS